MDANEKYCPNCKRTLPLDAFHKNKRLSTGRSTYCKECHNARSRVSKAKAREVNRSERVR